MTQFRVEYSALPCNADRQTENYWLGKIRRHLSWKQRRVDDVANLAGGRSLVVLVMVPEFGRRQSKENRNRQARHHAPAYIGTK
jgi:hypothetical protein